MQLALADELTVCAVRRVPTDRFSIVAAEAGCWLAGAALAMRVVALAALAERPASEIGAGPASSVAHPSRSAPLGSPLAISGSTRSAPTVPESTDARQFHVRSGAAAWAGAAATAVGRAKPAGASAVVSERAAARPEMSVVIRTPWEPGRLASCRRTPRSTPRKAVRRARWTDVRRGRRSAGDRAAIGPRRTPPTQAIAPGEVEEGEEEPPSPGASSRRSSGCRCPRLEAPLETLT
jgi:hypothetical protein